MKYKHLIHRSLLNHIQPMKIKKQITRGLAGSFSTWLGFCSVTFCALTAAHAADAIWDGDTDTLWATADNWSAEIPGFGHTATFNATSINTTINIGTISLSKVVFDTDIAAAYTLGLAAETGTITFADGTTTAIDMTNAVVTDQIINANLTLGTAIASNTTFSNASTSGLLTLAGGITGGAVGTADAKTLTIAGAGATTISGLISNGGATSVALEKITDSTGLLILSGGNTYTGGTTISAGTVRTTHNNALGTAGTVILNGTSAVLEVADGITISRTLIASDTGDNKTIRLQTDATAGEYSGAITISETAVGDFDLSAAAAGTLTVSGVIGASSGANINKEGAGMVVLSGDNSLFDKNVTINAGILRAGHNNAFGVGTASLANTDAVLELANGITINRALTIADAGNKKTLALQAGATSAEYSGNITNSEGTAGNFEVSVGSSGTLTLSGVVSGSGIVNTGVLIKTGDGTLVLSGTADNTSVRNLMVNVTAGELHLGKTSSGSVHAVYGISGIANGATVKLTGTGGDQIYSANSSNLYGVQGMVAGSTFNLNGNSETLTYLKGSGGIVDGGSGTPTLTIGDKSVTFDFAGVIQNSSGTLALTKILNGSVTLSGAHTYTGTTTITGGTLILTGASQATSAITSSGGGKLGLEIGSPVTAANATVTFTGRTVLVTGTPTLASYTLLTASSIVGTPTLAAPAPSGYSLQVVDDNKLLLVKDAPSDPYEGWAGSGVNFDADANNDGVENGQAWFLGAANPNDNGNALLPKSSQNAGALVLEFDCLDATARGAAVFQVQYSNDLGQLDPWAGTDVPGTVGTFTEGVVDFEVTDPEPAGGLLKVVATIPADEAPAGKLFGRLQGVK